MIIARVEIRSFKSFGPTGAVISLEPMTALVGENNAGKSNAIQAIDLFRNYSKAKVSRNCFHAHDLGKPIEIKVTYGGLDDAERRLFRRHLSPDGTLTIVQRIWANEEVKAGKETAAEPDARAPGGQAPQGGDTNDVSVEQPPARDIQIDPVEEKTAEITVCDVEWLNEPPTNKRDIEKLWKQASLLVGEIDFKAWSGLPTDSPPDRDTLIDKVADFWDQHWDEIPKHGEGSGTRPLGWPSRLIGNLPDVVHVPAAKKIEEETKSTKSSPFGALLDWMVRSVQADLQQRLRASLSGVFREAMDGLPKDVTDEATGETISRLELINRTLNANVIGSFGCQLELGFEEPAVGDTLFGTAVLKADDGFTSYIGDKGHGFQRATMLTVVRTYLKLRPKLDASVPGLRRVVFLIEEPEIYLHPTLRRSAYALFRQLSDQGDQVIYSTHDGYMLDVLNFHEVRVVRRDRSRRPAPATCVDEVSADVLAEVWRRLTGHPEIRVESVRARMHNVYDPYRNEGFLSSKVLLCEGATERLALPIYFRAIGYDLDEHGVAIIDVGSVDLLDCFYLMFTELGIQTYALWDGDLPNEQDVSQVGDKQRRQAIKDKSDRNRDLCQLLGVPMEPRSDGCYFCAAELVADRAAVMPRAFEHTLMSTLPNSEEVKGEATRLYGSDSKPLAARYYAIRSVERGNAEGEPGKYVPDFVKRVAERLKVLPAPKKQSVILGIRAQC